MATKNILDAIHDLVNRLATKFNFDAAEATKFLESGDEPKAAPKTKAKPKAKAKTEPKEEEVKEKRIKRMTPTLGKQLKTALSNVGLELDDRLKKEFVKFVDDLDEDTWKSNGLSDHMRHFAESKKKPDEKDDPPKVVTLETLQKTTLLTETETPGVYWTGDGEGDFITGPEEIEDEDMKDPVKFDDGHEYVVGEKTGRVYLVGDKKDVFAGFVGIGKFKSLK